MVSKYSFSWIFVTRDSAYINWSFKSLSWKFRTDCYLYRENCKKFKIRYAFRFSGQFEFSPIFSNLFSNRKLKLIILTLGPLDCIKISKAQYQSNIKYHQYHNLVRWIIRLSRKKKKNTTSLKYHSFFELFDLAAIIHGNESPRRPMNVIVYEIWAASFSYSGKFPWPGSDIAVQS